MTQLNAIGYGIDGIGADLNTTPDEMEVISDEHIRVLTEGGRENFRFKDADGRIWYSEYDELWRRLSRKLKEIQSNPFFYDVSTWRNTSI